MTDDITAKALALVNALGSEPTGIQATKLNRNDIFHEALCRAIEQHEAFKQEVSDVVEDAFGLQGGHTLHRFIIPKPKPDPLVEVAESLGFYNTAVNVAANIRTALEARGLEIREKGQ